MATAIGVVALQGDFEAHRQHLTAVGAAVTEIRTAADLERVEAVVLPGGESTTMSLLLQSSGLLTALGERIEAGMAVFGTCAGLILLGSRVLDGRADQSVLGALDITVRRNGYGRQAQSFEAELELRAGGDGGSVSFPGVFIRAPRIEEHGESVSVLAEHETIPVLVQQGRIVGASFHPELTDDLSLHRWFVDDVVGAVR